MNKYLFALIFVVCSYHFFAQTDTIQRFGTLKIGKPKRDSIYIKASMNFFQFQEGHKKNAQTYSQKDVFAPVPKTAVTSASPFDYNQFFSKRAKVQISDLESKTTDTVRIQVKILENGKAYIKDLTPLLVLNGVPAYYDSKNKGYLLDGIHWKCLKALREIETWEPGFVLIEKRDKFKGQTVIKAKKKKVTSTGTLTVVFSLVPFDELNQQ